MSAIRTNAAATMLGVSPSTLRSWERRFGYPMPRRTDGGHRQFDLSEIEALRQAFDETHNISSAVSIARERGPGLASPGRLRGALAEFNDVSADRLLEESLAVRSVERTVEAVLLPAVAAMQCPPDSLAGNTPEYGFAWRYATGWLAAAARVAPAATRDEAVLIFEATQTMDLDSLFVQALELVLRRSGLRVLTLPMELEGARLTRALCALTPAAVVLGGGRASMDALARLVYAVRQSSGAAEVFDFRGALPQTGASTVPRLGPGPLTAGETLRERLGASRRTAPCAAVS